MRQMPDYSTTRTHLKDLEPLKEYTLTHIGVYLSEKYGPTCYADIRNNGRIERVSLPKRYLYKIEEHCYDEQYMKDIHGEKKKLKIEPYKAGIFNSYAIQID